MALQPFSFNRVDSDLQLNRLVKEIKRFKISKIQLQNLQTLKILFYPCLGLLGLHPDAIHHFLPGVFGLVEDRHFIL